MMLVVAAPMVCVMLGTKPGHEGPRQLLSSGPIVSEPLFPFLALVMHLAGIDQ